jgi:hypothetical protein
MPRSTGRPKAITDLVKKAGAAFDKNDYFKAETALEKAVGMLRARHDWAGMAEVLGQLRDARRARRKLALASRAAVCIIDADIPECGASTKGRYLIQPPLVGADARRFRLASKDNAVAAAVVCREPTTRLGEIPVVAIAPGATIRVRIEPPGDESKPSASWFRSAMEALAKEALAMDQPTLEIAKRVDRLLALIDAVPDEDGPHDRLIEVCENFSEDD